MKGLELSRGYYGEFGEPMLREKFPDLLPFVAVGFCGAGSECLGYDDEVSRDHDFEPGFTIFLPGEDVVDRRRAFELERAYAKLPSEFAGVPRLKLAPVGGARHGVVRTADFFRDRTGAENGNLSLHEWLSVPEPSLLEAVCGEIFFDGYGEVTAIREQLAYFPEDIRRKKLAGNLLLMAQSGQYNYKRCLAHGEEGAAQLAAIEFARAASAAVFLLNRRYQPFYKWKFRTMRSLPLLPLTAELLEYLITTGNGADIREEKSGVIETVAADVIDALTEQGLTGAVCLDLEKHAYSVNDGIADAGLRNAHVLAAV
ncbi:MAG: DUF4037 domain-containing protein [Clostridia bacterium]|nr:DUF4037 domain-containing protein [Clostridia bacterium]